LTRLSNKDNEEIIEKFLTRNSNENRDKNEDEIKENIFKSFQIDLKNFFKTLFYYLKYTGIKISDVLDFYYWEWEIMIKEMQEYIEKEKEEREKEEKKYKSDLGSYKIPSLSDITKLAKGNFKI